MSHVQDYLEKKRKRTSLNQYGHHLLWSGWEVGQSLADMKMCLAPAVSPARDPVVDTCLRKGLWEGLMLVEKSVFVALDAAGKEG